MNILILYGSQTGTAQNMSEELYYDIKYLNYNVERDILNNIIDINILNNYDLVIIMCSTTGNGDFPDNALKFFSKIKDRKLNKNILQKVNYSICGLGDSNYNMFCFSGKRLQKRFNELKAKEVIPLYLMDAVYDDEEQLYEFKNKIFDYLNTKN